MTASWLTPCTGVSIAHGTSTTSTRADAEVRFTSRYFLEFSNEWQSVADHPSCAPPLEAGEAEPLTHGLVHLGDGLSQRRGEKFCYSVVDRHVGVEQLLEERAEKGVSCSLGGGRYLLAGTISQSIFSL